MLLCVGEVVCARLDGPFGLRKECVELVDCRHDGAVVFLGEMYCRGFTVSRRGRSIYAVGDALSSRVMREQRQGQGIVEYSLFTSKD